MEFHLPAVQDTRMVHEND